MKTLNILIIVFLFVTSFIYAQLPHTFTQVARNINYGEAMDLAVGNDGTVFVANGDDGLRAYTYDGSSFTNTAHIDDGGTARGIAVGADGKVFLAIWRDGLRAYSYDGSSFINTAHIIDSVAWGPSRPWPVSIGSYGTVFVGTESWNGYMSLGSGLFAYTYDGTSFTNTACKVMGIVRSIALVPNESTLFVLSEHHLHYDLYAYIYDGISFTSTARFCIGRTENDIAVGLDGTVFMAVSDGLRALTYDGTSFTINAYTDSINASAVTIGSDGTIFVASRGDGLRAFTYDGSSFTNTAYINDGLGADRLALGLDGTVFLANESEGLIAYSYSGYTGLKKTNAAMPIEKTLHQNYPNPFNPTTSIEFTISKTEFVAVKIYNMLGQEVATLVSKKLIPGNYKYTWDASGFASGVYYYRIDAKNYTNTRKMILLR